MTSFGQNNPLAGPPLVSVEGTYREIGFELGARTRVAITANLEIYLRRFQGRSRALAGASWIGGVRCSLGSPRIMTPRSPI